MNLHLKKMMKLFKLMQIINKEIILSIKSQVPSMIWVPIKLLR